MDHEILGSDEPGRPIVDLRARCLASEESIIQTFGQSFPVTREYL